MNKKETLNGVGGVEKAAAFLILLGPEAATKIMKKLDDDQVEQICAAITNMGTVREDLARQVLAEFSQQFTAVKSSMCGGASFSREVLEKSMGAEKAGQIMNRIGNVRYNSPFDFIKNTDPAQLLNFIQSEHPQTIALVLAHLESDQSAVMLSSLNPELQTDVVRRIATMDKTTPDIVKDVEHVLQRKISTVFNEGLTATGGVKTVAEVLNRADRATEKTILESFEKDNPELASEIKNLMFVFEDLVLVDDRGIQQALKEVDSKELALALKTGSEEVKQKILRNMSKRAAEAVKEEMQFMGPVRLRQVEEAQQKIVAIVRSLEESGEIVIQGRGGKEDEIVG